MNDALRQRAELHLVGRLLSEWRQAMSRHQAGLGSDDPDENRLERRQRFREGAETYRAIDVLSSSEVETWLRRFASVVEDPAEMEEPEPDPDTRRRTGELLDRLLADRARGEGSAGQDPVLSFTRTVRTLEYVGALSREEAVRWLDRLNESLGLPSLAEQEELDRRRTCIGRELRRVIAGPIAGEGALEITHLELYSDGAMIYWHERRRPEQPEDRVPRVKAPPLGRGGGAQPPDQPETVVLDDLGTAYECQQGRHPSIMALVPAVPDAASRLDIRYGHRRFEIPLG
ncbi:MAG: hypothetical protein M3N16_00555 [Actinomycetota bacterium]|nr:hypothetical protein [Actinomycetota bacterium]